ncbi:hypothetical protein G3480_16910 [Thiorhodococcus mannitoliphagus]|uniref:Flagellar biosynthesis protein FlgE n=1 Tax=Thiorhodococcus mannitoliphagus TaxID=329406 RepID=A0A6P1E2Q0_9GAMM|nr:hypothetical protein [Thiorhodococcus mannitoliphagus]NEX21965.1 hypothetical protein [Thiorhodococcus mannitoliphagus]
MISGVGQAGFSGIQAGMEGLRQNAAEIAGARREDGSSVRDIAAPLVEQKENLRQVEASAKVFKASDEALKSLIDIMA